MVTWNFAVKAAARLIDPKSAQKYDLIFRADQSRVIAAHLVNYLFSGTFSPWQRLTSLGCGAL